MSTPMAATVATTSTTPTPAAITITGITLSILLFVGLLWPTLPMYFKRIYFKVNRITLVTQRRLYVSLLQGLIFTVPSLIFVIHRSISGDNPFKSFARNYLPLAAYVFFPIFIAWMRPLAANPLDLWDILLVAGLIAPVVVHIVLDGSAILFDQPFTNPRLWIDFHSLYLIAGSLSIFIYTVLRPLPDVGLGKEMKLPSLWDAFVAVLGFLLIIAVLPILIFTDHAFDRVTNIPPIWVLVNFLLILCFVALPLELVFRGVIQNLFHARIEVFRDVRNYTIDHDTTSKVEYFARVRRFLFGGNSGNGSHGGGGGGGRNSMTINGPARSRHQYHQTQELLELSLQLGAPAQAQNPLQPGAASVDSSYASLDPIPSAPAAQSLRRKGDQYRESLLDTQAGSIRDSNDPIVSGLNNGNNYDHNHNDTDNDNLRDGLIHYGNDDDGNIAAGFRPEPLFPTTPNNTNANVAPSRRLNAGSERYHQTHANNNSGGGNSSAAGSAGSTTRPPKSVISYSLGSKNGQAVTTTHQDIRDATSQTLGVGFVSKQDAQIAAMNAKEDYLLNIDQLDHTEEDYVRMSGLHDDDHDGSASVAGARRFFPIAPPKLRNIPINTEAIKAKQRGYGLAFEESPIWPTWQERNAQFYRRSIFHWFLLPSKLDYLCLVVSALIYAGAMTYNLGYFIQHNQSPPAALQPYTWFTLFAVLTWQGFICGLLWRMSSQIWSPVLVTAAFFTLGAFWLGIDG